MNTTDHLAMTQALVLGCVISSGTSEEGNEIRPGLWEEVAALRDIFY